MAKAKLSLEENNNNIRNSIGKLESNVERMKSEINNKIQYLIESINTQGQNLLSEIDTESIRASEPLKKYENIIQARMETKKRIAKDLEGDDELIAKLTNDIDEEMEKMSVQVPIFKLQWNPNFNKIYDEKIGKLKILLDPSQIESVNMPLWSTLNKGKADNEVGEASAIVIDPETSNIYVGDASAGKILIMNRAGEYMNTLKLRKPSSIARMVISQNFIYCKGTDTTSYTVYRLNKVTGELLNKFTSFGGVNAITATPESFVCTIISKLNIFSLDLSRRDQFQLKFPISISTITIAIEMKYINAELVILVPSLFVSPLQIYDMRGNFLRGISQDIPTGGLVMTFILPFMCIDEHWNIYITYHGYKLVNVFNKDGTLVASIGKPGEDSSGVHHPRGIALDRDGNLIVCNKRHKNILQAY